jgi:N-acetylglucosaminyldiphosphoundecaprenol N-acetyl-beta-D-mannosaminyltransferase
MVSRLKIISLAIDDISFKDSLQKIVDRGLQKKSGFICFANVHMVIEAHNDDAFRKSLEKALFVLPDGKPLCSAARWIYHKKQERISGMDFMPALLEQADLLGAKIFLYGSTNEVLSKLAERINEKYPEAIIAGKISPPFRQLTSDETDSYLREINESGAQFVLVALGCPKQEKWMAANYERISAVLLGVGGAFPVVAGLQKRSPVWMQKFALEWLYRLFQEPGRMFKRYLYTNSLFIALLIKELFFRYLNPKKRALPLQKKDVETVGTEKIV